MKSGKLGCYLLERVNVWKAGHIPVRQYYTLVGTTDHVMDAILDQATERLKTEMENILCQFEDPAPVIDCVLAYHFMEKQSLAEPWRFSRLSEKSRPVLSRPVAFSGRPVCHVSQIGMQSR